VRGRGELELLRRHPDTDLGASSIASRENLLRELPVGASGRGEIEQLGAHT